MIDTILVPQGAEYKAVCKGLSQVAISPPTVFPIPVGTLSVSKFLKDWIQSEHFSHLPQSKVLLMGLCGSLSPRYNVGDIVIYQSCIYPCSNKNKKTLLCDLELTKTLQSKLQKRAFLGVGLTSDRVISSANEKLHLGQVYGADVVDMEGFAALEILSQAGVAVAMMRVVSDNTHHNIPDLSHAFNANGSLQPLPLAICLLRQPIAATRLISGSLRGLRVLRHITESVGNRQ
ncbi:MAG: phosphorylase [Scytonema sp. PMC 1069.18]|nr:phosphorylase [Scytonema sp. PMC 1069.18]MEC4886779.1 phosphorylase [Scytonema sp. PMC 1070.18]